MVSFILKNTRLLHNILSSPISLLTYLSALLSPSDKWECSLHAKVFMSLKFLFPKAVFQKPLLCSALHSSFLSYSKFLDVYFFWSPSYILVSHHTSGMNYKRSVSQWGDTTYRIIPLLWQWQPSHVPWLCWELNIIVIPMTAALEVW